MKKIIFMTVLYSVLMAFASCKKNDIQPTPVKVSQKAVMDSGDEDKPVPPPHP